MSTKSNDLYCDTEALENVKEKISLLHKGYVILGPTSNGGGLKEDGNRIRNILNSLDAYDNSYDNFFDKYDLSSKANVIYNKSNKFVESWIDFSEAFSKSYKLLGDSTTTATDIMENFDSSGSNTAPRINSPYDYVSYLKKQGKDKEAASIEALLEGGVTGASIVSKNGTKSKNNNATNKNTGTGTGSASAVHTSPSSLSTPDKNGPKNNGYIIIDEIDEEEKLKKGQEEVEKQLKEIKKQQEALKKQQEEIKKQQEVLKKQQEEIKKQQEALKKQQEEIKKQKDEIAKKQEELAKKDEELKKREEELNNREQQNNNTPANEPTTPNDSNNGNNNTPSDNSDNNISNSAPQNTVYRQENTTPVANNSTAPAETGTVDTPTTTPTTPEKVENITPSTRGDSGSLGTGNDLFGDDPEPTTTTTTLPDADTTTKSSKSGFNPIPIAVGLGAAVAGGVGVKAYKNHKQNSEFDDANEDSFTNGNRFWTDDEPNVVNSEQNELSGDTLFNEQTTSPSYSAVTNQANNNDTWSVQDTSTRVDDSRTYDLLGEN